MAATHFFVPSAPVHGNSRRGSHEKFGYGETTQKNRFVRQYLGSATAAPQHDGEEERPIVGHEKDRRMFRSTACRVTFTARAEG
jgi:hypothetical protein